MKYGVLSDYFDGAGAKFLTDVEVNKLRSNQHEFQGVHDFRKFLGEPAEKIKFPTTYYWLDDKESEDQLKIDSSCTWYDGRLRQTNRSSEGRIYYPAASEQVVHKAKPGDLLLIAKTNKGTLLIIICPADSSVGLQLLWLFGLNPIDQLLDAKELNSGDSETLGFSARLILDDLGIELEETEPYAFAGLIEKFGLTFPATAEFSHYARSTSVDVDPIADPDNALVEWMNHEEVLFRYLERKIVSEKLAEGFVNEKGTDVDGFIKYSLGVHNRRKSRAGWAFGHHIEEILRENGIRYKREGTTEKRNGPDFLFPGEDEYHDSAFNAEKLAMLAAKTTCKDRWRQVLAEANRIKTKHLVTLQPGISESQTNEMQSEKLQLVVPKSIFNSYKPDQQDWIMDVRSFLDFIKYRQT